MPLTLLKINQVSEITGLGRSTIYARVAQKSFPEPIKLGQRTSRWIESEVADWIEAQILLSRGEQHEPE